MKLDIMQYLPIILLLTAINLVRSIKQEHKFKVYLSFDTKYISNFFCLRKHAMILH